MRAFNAIQIVIFSQIYLPVSFWLYREFQPHWAFVVPVAIAYMYLMFFIGASVYEKMDEVMK